jgi:PST family polysaccharide transporter
MTTIRQRTVSGLGWNGATQILSVGFQFGISVVLARLLSPRDFGLVGMVLIFTGFASWLSEMGLGPALIQHRAVSERHLNSVFWANVAAALLLTLLLGWSAPLVARFYQEPELRLLTIIAAATLMLSSLNVVQNALLARSLNFRTKFWIGSVSVLTSGIVAIAMAFAGAGVWSLIGQSITSAAVQVAVLWRLSPWRPVCSFDFSAFKELMQFSGHLMGSSMLHYWGRHIDKLLIGRLLGSSALGIYALADKLMRLPVTNVTDNASAVMFPVFSTIQADLESVQRAYQRATRMIALVTFPMMIGLLILAESTILTVYGENWLEAVGILQVLCLSGMAQSVYFTGGWIFLSQGRTDIVFRWSIYTTLVRVAGVLVGAPWGLVGVAWAYGLGTFLFICYPTWSCAGRLVRLEFKALIKNVAGPFCCAAGMGLCLWVSDRWIMSDHAGVARLAIQVPLGMLIYGFLIRHFRLEAFKDVQDIIRERSAGQHRFLRWLAADRFTSRDGSPKV